MAEPTITVTLSGRQLEEHLARLDAVEQENKRLRAALELMRDYNFTSDERVSPRDAYKYLKQAVRDTLDGKPLQ